MISAARARSNSLCLRLLLVGAALLVSGCGSPQAMSGVGARIFGAVPGLSYVNGDVEAGTTTLASLPLLTYRTTEEHEGYADSEAWILPLLGRFAQTDRYVRVTWDGQAQGPPPDWWDRERKRDGKKPRKRRRKRTRSDEPGQEPEASEPDTGTGVPRAKPKKRSRPKSKKNKKKSDPAPGGSATLAGKEHVELRLERPGRIVKQLPQQKTQWDILFGLIGHHAERPARVLVRPLAKGAGSKKRKKKGKRRRGDVVYEVGVTRDSFRFLPLFSYRRGPEGKQFMFWPLLMGWEREGDERYMRLFYFLKIPLR